MSHTNAHIRELFLQPRPNYPIAEAATLLGLDLGEMRAWMKSGELEGVDTDDGLALPWAELVFFGMDLWSQEVVEETLGPEISEAIPELLRWTELEVRIPRIEIVALQRLAAADGKTVSALLAWELRDLISVHSKWLASEVPGFAAAFSWPEAV